MDSSKYDNYLLKILGDKHIKKGTVYYDNEYLLELLKNLIKDDLFGVYHGELSTNSKGVKMTSIGSSSRFCYLASKGLYADITEHEKTDVKNDCCHPHYDGYARSTNTFYEFKCHELCDNSTHSKLSESYVPLLHQYFTIDTHPHKLRFSDFGIEYKDNPSIYNINFDVKQFICHILGILTVATPDNRAALKYVWVIPGKNINKELDDFIHDVEKQIKGVFDGFNKVEVKVLGNKYLLEELIKFELDVVEAKTINDFVLNNI